MTLTPTPGQTVGPFFSIGMSWRGGDAAGADAPGAVVVSGRVLDGAGDPVPDAVVETWQADPEGFARAATDDEGRWRVRVVKPAAAGGAAPHLAALVYARGLLHRLATRIYFADEETANAGDPVLRALPDDAARATLLAQPAVDGYRFDIHLQGDAQTAFFSL